MPMPLPTSAEKSALIWEFPANPESFWFSKGLRTYKGREKAKGNVSETGSKRKCVMSGRRKYHRTQKGDQVQKLWKVSVPLHTYRQELAYNYCKLDSQRDSLSSYLIGQYLPEQQRTIPASMLQLLFQPQKLLFTNSLIFSSLIYLTLVLIFSFFLRQSLTM